jgi:hypothetical protein
MTIHQVRATGKLVLPRAGLGKVGMNHTQVRMETAKDLRVRRVFVDRDNFAKIFLLKSRDKVLPNEARSPGNHNLSGCHETPIKRA